MPWSSVLGKEAEIHSFGIIGRGFGLLEFSFAFIMTRRYFAPDLGIEGGIITLSDAEAQHAIRVMRVQNG